MLDKICGIYKQGGRYLQTRRTVMIKQFISHIPSCTNAYSAVLKATDSLWNLKSKRKVSHSIM